MSEEITRHRKRPVVVEAIQWTGGNVAEVMDLTGRENFDVLGDQDRANCDDPDATATVFDKLHSTWVLVFDGQWIIKGVKGEFYPCADDVFRETYEPAGDAHVSGKTLGQIGYEAFQDSRHPVNRTAWTHPAVADARPAWETAMQAVAAHAAGTAAEDDGAAEIMRLRESLSSPAELARWVETSHGDHPEWVDELRALLPVSQQPQPAPELAAAMGEARIVAAQRDERKAQRDALQAELDQLRERVARVAASLDADALATAPSRKSQIQEDAARRIREAIG